MFRSRFFWKLYASYAALVFITAAIIGLLVHGSTKQALVEQLETGLRHESVTMGRYAASILQGEGDASMGTLRQLADGTERRLTVISPDGRVLFDSEQEPVGMDNHGNRPEVLEAIEEGFGTERHFSRTLEKSMLYVAHAERNEDGELFGIMRVSIPLDEVKKQLGATTGSIAVGAAIGCLVALLIGLFVGQRITAPISEMTRSANAMTSGSYETQVTDLPDDEIGTLGLALNRLSAELAARIAEISADESQLRAMLAGMAEGVVAIDLQDRVVFSNYAVNDLLGIDRRTIEGKRLFELVRDSGLDRLIDEARGSDKAASRELTVSVAGGEKTLRAQAHAYGSPAQGVVIVLDDISELRKLENIRQDFVANVSHELKTPLTSIRGFVETLLGGALHDEQNNVRFLQKIDQNVSRLTHLVSDLLSLARIEAARDTLVLERVELRQLVMQALVGHESAARQKGIDCRLGASSEPVYVRGDAESITQVVDNLISNAITYTQDDGAVVISLETNEHDGLLHVRDTGIGIPEGDMERIFERFYRVDKARSREVGGTGLGLAIVKHLVNAMSGEVTVESKYGEGSCFTVRIPLAQ